MRLGERMRAASSSVPWLFLALVTNPAAAQFREVHPDQGSESAVEIRLTPTRENFVAPKLEPVPDGVPTPATQVKVGTPTPADKPLEVAAPPAETKTEPTPGERPTSKPTDGETKVSTPVTAETDASSATSDPAANVGVELPGDDTNTTLTDASIQPLQGFSAFRRPATEATATAPTPKTDTSPMTFNQVTPGATTLSDVETQWGLPAKTVEIEAGKVLLYRAPGFQQVDLIANADSDTVASIFVHLSEPLDVARLEEYLQLNGLRAVEITDTTGKLLGRGYPERGVLLNYVTDGTAAQISHVALEPINGELFRLRAENDHEQRYSESLADLEQAVTLNPQDAKSYWLQAEIKSLIGRSDEAWQCVSNANRIEPSNALYQLTRARLAAGNGDLTEALLFTKNVAQDKAAPAVLRARAEYQWGNLRALGPEPDLQEALNHHLKAIDLAAKHANDGHAEVRRMAKDILVDSHLAVAQDIALGHFQRQREVVPKWLTRATELAEDLITSDEGDASTRLEIYRTTLAVYSVLEGNFDASIAADEAISEGQRLVAASKDRMYQFRVERELSEVLYHAAKVEHRCGRLTLALKYANNAVVLLEGDKTHWQPSLFDRMMSGQLYFLTGSIYAMKDDDHTEAVKWFDKALPTFDDERLVHLIDSSAFGDLFVSMGVSYWESGDRNRAIELTQAGADLMQEGVQTGTMEIAALAVPYGNLAAMHQQMGNGDKAKHFATMMAKVENESKSVRR